MAKILFRVDAGRVWGVSLGHAVRSSILARRLAETHQIYYLMKDYEDGVSFVRDMGFDVLTMPVDADSNEAVTRVCEEIKPQALICDLIETPYVELFNFCRKRGPLSVVFDTKGGLPGAPDVLVNPNIAPEFADYARIEGRTRLLLGPEYFMAGSEVMPGPIRDKAEKVMITMGGSDPAGLTVATLTALDGCFTDVELHVVLGPAFQGFGRMRELAQARQKIEIHEAPGNFLELLAGMDVVLTAGGLTLYECAWLGRPALTIPSIGHEERITRAFAELAGYVDLGRWQDGVTGPALVRALQEILADNPARRSMSEKASGLVDGKGADRILEVLDL